MRTSLLALAVAAGAAPAASPALNGIIPRGAQRGTEAELVFGGGRLADAVEVVGYAPGIAVQKLEPAADGNSVKVRVAIAPDARLGEYPFRVRCKSGWTEVRTFWVGALPAVAEAEPNNEFAAAQPIPLNVTVHGVVENEDVDYFVVDGKAGQRLSVEVEGQRLGNGFWDPFVSIQDAKRFELAVSDDSPLLGTDAGCSVKLPADGKYYVQVRDTSYRRGRVYRLHVGTFPRPTAVVPAGGKPGEELPVRFLGDPLGEIKQTVKLPAVADPYFRLHCVTPEGVSPSGFKVAIGDLPGVVEPGTNTGPAEAATMPAPGAAHGVISKPGEHKWFKFAAKKGQAFDVRARARALGSPLDSVCHVSKVGGAYIVGNDDQGGPDGRCRFTAPEDGEYLAYVHDFLGKGGPDYFFRLEVSAAKPGTTAGIPLVDGNNVGNQDRQAMAVPAGGRFATLVTVNRRDWGGPAAVSLDGLPAGVSLVAEACDPGLGQVPVVFEAKPDAPLAGTLADLRVTPTDPKLAAAGTARLEANYNLALNNVAFHKVPLGRLAVAVTEAAPYSVEVVEPKAAVPQNGNITLKVVAKRAPGFKGPITVYPLFTPPNVGIQGQTVIPEGQTEALVPCNAAPNAQVKAWKTCFTAVADAGTGPVWTGSQLFTLRVDPPAVQVAQERTAVEQGQATTVFGKVRVVTPFAGKATAVLVGLPPKATAAPVELTKDSTEVSFAVATDKATPAGKHGVWLQVTRVVDGETVVTNVGGAELRVDVPLPPKATASKEPAKPAAPAKPAERRLSRLEQLRLEQQQKEKGGNP
jgi:hypothetical protein